MGRQSAGRRGPPPVVRRERLGTAALHHLHQFAEDAQGDARRGRHPEVKARRGPHPFQLRGVEAGVFQKAQYRAPPAAAGEQPAGVGRRRSKALTKTCAIVKDTSVLRKFVPIFSNFDKKSVRDGPTSIREAWH